MYSSISSLSLVTKHPFTNNMFTFFFPLSKGKSSLNSIQWRRKHKDSVSCKYHIFQMEELPTRPEVRIINMISLKQFLISTNTWH